jgi:exoribonuclease R
MQDASQKMRIAGVLQLTNRTLYGMTARKVPLYLFTPLNRGFPDMIVASTARKKDKNLLVLVNPIGMYEPGVPMQRGAIHSLIGECGDMSAERKAINYAYTPIRWETFPAIIEPEGNGHLSLEDVPTINIDPPGCRDIDDCVSIWHSDSCTHFAVTIADVGEWVKSNPWMEYAANIGQTLYDRDGKILYSMFPHEQRMSLTTGVRRLGIALMFDLPNEIAAVTNMRFEEVSIVNKGSYTYDNIHEATDFPVRTLRAVCEYFAKKPLPDPHDWIETLMTTYNLKLAEMLCEKRVGLLRAHDAPQVIKSLNYETLGLPKHLAMSSARYEHASTRATHYMFGKLYCHGTSPIRRWADVVNQLAAFKGASEKDYADFCNVTQMYAKAHARDTQFIDILEKPKKLAPGIVVSETRIWVEEWNRLISCPNGFEFGDLVEVDYHVDMSRPTWKQRVIFRSQKPTE